MNLLTINHRNCCLPKEEQSCRSSSSAYSWHCGIPGQKLPQAFWNTQFLLLSYWSGHWVRSLERWNETSLFSCFSWWKYLTLYSRCSSELFKLRISNRTLARYQRMFCIALTENSAIVLLHRLMQKDHISTWLLSESPQ